nr:hypothetical protein Ade03nite_09430 [Actinoplanes derwentensis]
MQVPDPVRQQEVEWTLFRPAVSLAAAAAIERNCGPVALTWRGTPVTSHFRISQNIFT